MSSRVEVIGYKFGALELKLRGLGVYFGGDLLNQRVGKLTVDQLREANNAAWKLCRSAERRMNRYCNATMYGNDPYDRAHQEYMVAKAVCTATWRLMREAA